MDILTRLREQGGTTIEWQVVNLDTEGIVIWFGPQYHNPEGKAREWLHEHRHTHTHHEVRRVEEKTLHAEAADEIYALRLRLRELASMWLGAHYRDEFSAEEIEKLCWQILGA